VAEAETERARLAGSNEVVAAEVATEEVAGSFSLAGSFSSFSAGLAVTLESSESEHTQPSVLQGHQR